MFDFPAIYKEADNLSNKTQTHYLNCLKVYFGLLLTTGVLLFYFNDLIWLKIINAVISLAIVGFSFYFFFYNFQGIWYSARAVAESIKTLSWRYALKVEPFDEDDEIAQSKFVDRIKAIVQMNHEFMKHIDSRFSTDQAIPENMSEIRNWNVDKRKNYYHEFRVKEQQQWYQIKSLYNKKMANLFFIILIIISIGITLLLFKDLADYTTSNTNKFPINVLISAISIIFTWIQTKKYKELKSSYALTSHEIGFIAKLSTKACSEEKLNEYVTNAENAFSREHTQWLARKDE